MNLPISPYGKEYFESLRDFRDTALSESSYLGRRIQIGKFSFGTAHAQWRSAEGGLAHLIDEGIRYGNSSLKLYPTTLRLLHHPGETGIEAVTFKMDIDDIGCIAVYRNMISTGSFLEVMRAELSHRADSKHDLSRPTDDDREFLYSEMQRGATGLYPFDERFED